MGAIYVDRQRMEHYLRHMQWFCNGYGRTPERLAMTPELRELLHTGKDDFSQKEKGKWDGTE